MTQKQYLKNISPERFSALTTEEKGQYITEESMKFANLVLQNVDKMYCGDAVKILGLLQAAIIVQKITGIVPDEEFLQTTKMYLENMKITNGGENDTAA